MILDSDFVHSHALLYTVRTILILLLLYYTWQVKGIMSQNMDLMMQRGEKLEHGLEKAGK